MPLDGAAWAAEAAAFATWLEGDTPDQLVAVRDATVVPFVHDEAAEVLDDTEAGGLAQGTLAACTRTPLVMGDAYTYRGETWTVVGLEQARAGGNDWPYRILLERHAR